MSAINLTIEPEIVEIVETTLNEIFRPWNLLEYWEEPNGETEWMTARSEFDSILNDLSHGDYSLEDRARVLCKFFEGLHESEITEAIHDYNLQHD